MHVVSACVSEESCFGSSVPKTCMVYPHIQPVFSSSLGTFWVTHFPPRKAIDSTASGRPINGIGSWCSLNT